MAIEIKRVVGSTKVLDKDVDNYLRVQISLNDFPEREWLDCFLQPTTWISKQLFSIAGYGELRFMWL
jgi:hypothetical protein